MAKWSLEKKYRKQHDSGAETITEEATVILEDDPDDPVTLADVGELVEALTTVDGIPETAVIGQRLEVPLRWEVTP